MPAYNFPVPRSRGLTDNEACDVVVDGKQTCARDLILWILLGRYAGTDNVTHEFETIFNKQLNAIEIDIPDGILQQIESIGIGPNLQRYLTWLDPFSDGLSVSYDETGKATLEIDYRLRFTDTAWDDLRVNVNNIRVGSSNIPTWIPYKGGRVLEFSDQAVGVNEEIGYFAVQMPHSYKSFTDLQPHVHWVGENTNAGNVKWVLSYSVANVFGTFPDPILLSSVDANSDVADYHNISSLGTLDGSNINLSAMLVCSIKRNSRHVDDTYTGGARLLEVDFHYQKDKIGSDNPFSND
jgi:hypothetical protein